MEHIDESGEHLAPRIIEALSLQVSLQLELLRAELDRDLWSLARKLMPFGAGIPLVGLGYTLISVAGALAIATLLMPADVLLRPALGMAIVGTINLALGCGISWFAYRAMKPRRRAPMTTWSNDVE